MYQHGARAVVPGAYAFLSTGEFLCPHTYGLLELGDTVILKIRIIIKLKWVERKKKSKVKQN